LLPLFDFRYFFDTLHFFALLLTPSFRLAFHSPPPPRLLLATPFTPCCHFAMPLLMIFFTPDAPLLLISFMPDTSYAAIYERCYTNAAR